MENKALRVAYAQAIVEKMWLKGIINDEEKAKICDLICLKFFRDLALFRWAQLKFYGMFVLPMVKWVGQIFFKLHSSPKIKRYG